MKKIISQSTFYESEIINSNFVKAKIIVCDYEQIANGTKFTKESIINAIPSLDYVPVVGYWKEDESNFKGHGISYYLDESGNLKEDVKTIPYGVVIKGTARFENVTVGYHTREALVCDCFLWKNRGEEQINKVEENICNQSMEISINQSIDRQNYIEITDFNFDALCILGNDTQPAFNCGSIRTYSKNDFEADYKHMIEALNKYLNYEKGGEKINMDENKDLNTNSQEEFAKGDKEKEEKSCKKNCEEEKAEDEELKEEEDFSCKNKKKKCEEEDYENKINELNSNYSSLEAKYSELETSNKELKSKYEVLLEEVTLLRQYKADKEEAYRQSEETRIFSQFEDLKGNEKFDKLVSESRNYELEELEEKCFAIYGMVSKSKAKPNKKEEKKPIVDKVYSEECVNTVDKLSATFEKYLNK